MAVSFADRPKRKIRNDTGARVKMLDITTAFWFRNARRCSRGTAIMLTAIHPATGVPPSSMADDMPNKNLLTAFSHTAASTLKNQQIQANKLRFERDNTACPTHHLALFWNASS